MAIYAPFPLKNENTALGLPSGRARANAIVQSTVILRSSASETAPVYVPRQDIAALGKLLLVSGLSREFLPASNENTINGIIQSFVAMSDWPLIEQNFRVDLAGLCGAGQKDQGTDIINRREVRPDVPSFYTRDLAHLTAHCIALIDATNAALSDIASTPRL